MSDMGTEREGREEWLKMNLFLELLISQFLMTKPNFQKLRNFLDHSKCFDGFDIMLVLVLASN